jgi:hypothetical protein
MNEQEQATWRRIRDGLLVLAVFIGLFWLMWCYPLPQAALTIK